GWSVLAETYGVVRPDEHDVGLTDCGEADRRSHVVAEVEEGAAEWESAAVERDAVHRRRHGVLADPEVDQPAARLLTGLHTAVRGGRPCGTSPVRRRAPRTSGRAAGRGSPWSCGPRPHRADCRGRGPCR